MPPRKKMTKPKAPKDIPPPTKTAAEQREEWNRASDMIAALNKMSKDTKMKVLVGAGVGSEFFTCYMCGSIKPRSQFYTSTDFNVRTGVTRICKTCFEQLAAPDSSKTTDEVDAARVGLKYALEYLDQPFFERLYQSAVRESGNSSDITGSGSVAFRAYKRSIASAAYKGLRWRDGEGDVIDHSIAQLEDGNKEMTIEEHQEFMKNKSDALRIVGYYPFESEPLVEQPQMYAEFAGYLDGQKDEYPPFWIASVIQIIKNNVAITKLEKYISELNKDPNQIGANLTAIKQATAAKAEFTEVNILLAKENCISAKNSKGSVRGEDSWTGHMKGLRDLNLRDYDVNKFDIDTCAGMQQVADISMASILKEISLDENDYTEIVKSQREMLRQAQHEADVAKERARLLLRENLDLKRFMDEQNFSYQDYLTNNELFDQGFFTSKASTVKLNSDDENIFEVDYEDADEEVDESELTEAEETVENEENVGDADA